MWLMKEWSTSMWTIAGVLAYLRRLPSSVLLECGRCGSAIAVAREDGTSSVVFTIGLQQPKPSRYSVVLAVTDAGKLLISCGCSQSDARRSEIPSGVSAGISCTPTSSDKSARTCGCDPGTPLRMGGLPGYPKYWTCHNWPDCEHGKETT
jgi:hypothetical protein